MFTGLVEMLATVAEVIDQPPGVRLVIAAPAIATAAAIGDSIAINGCCLTVVAVDGVSLTLVDVEEDRFSIALIPHTLSVTTLGRLDVGMRVNVETDLLAKYVERQLSGGES